MTYGEEGTGPDNAAQRPHPEQRGAAWGRGPGADSDGLERFLKLFTYAFYPLHLQCLS